MPGAIWIGPTPNKYVDGERTVHGLVLHIQEGTEAGSEAWFTNPVAQASAHFLNPKTGQLKQLVDTKDAAWAEMAGNRYWISIENEGMSGDSLTPSQLENAAQLFAWIHTTYGIPLASTDDPNGQGLCWHGAGGDAWGGHTSCPGDPIKAQRPAIVARAQEILGQSQSAPSSSPGPSLSHPAWPGRYLKNDPNQPMMHGADVLAWQQRMQARGWGIKADGWYGPASALICGQFQREKGLTMDHIVGPKTWDAAWDMPVT